MRRSRSLRDSDSDSEKKRDRKERKRDRKKITKREVSASKSSRLKPQVTSKERGNPNSPRSVSLSVAASPRKGVKRRKSHNSISPKSDERMIASPRKRRKSLAVKSAKSIAPPKKIPIPQAPSPKRTKLKVVLKPRSPSQTTSTVVLKPATATNNNSNERLRPSMVDFLDRGLDDIPDMGKHKGKGKGKGRRRY